MEIEIKAQKDYLLTEATMVLPTSIAEIEKILIAAKSSGKIVALYNQGGVIGLNVEQRTKIPEKIAEQIRELLGLGTTAL